MNSGNQIAEGERIRLRNLELSDIADLHQILSDAETMKYYPKPYSTAQVKEWVKRSIQSYKDFGYGLWAVELKSEKIFIGQCGISNQEVEGEIMPEIGFHINKSYWGNGYGLESTRLAMFHGFHELNLNLLSIITSIENAPAQRIAMNLGMDEYGMFNKTFEKATIRHVMFRITKDQWRISSSN